MATKRPDMALTEARKHTASWYTRHYQGRRFTTPLEERQILLLVDAGGFSYRYIAKRVFGNGNPRYRVTAADLSRVGKVLRVNKRRVRDWRDGKTSESRSFIGSVLRTREPVKSNLRIAS